MSGYQFQKGGELDHLTCAETGTELLFARSGGELIGYAVYDRPGGTAWPLLWNNGSLSLPFDGAWKNHATILFPAVGGLRENSSRFRGKTITFRGNHGLARYRDFTLKSAEEKEGGFEVVYQLDSDEESLQQYPFHFSLQLRYRLSGTNLALTFSVENRGEEEMPFQCGWHPGFSTRLLPEMERSEWEVRLGAEKFTRFHVVDNGDSWLTGEKETVETAGPLTFSDHELYCTLMFGIEETDKRVCTMSHSASGRSIEVHFPDFPHLGLWANKEQDYICIEPWQGMDDHVNQEPFEEKVGMMFLKAGEKAEKRAEIRPSFSL